MVDIVSPAKRSNMMSGIKGKNTKPEVMIRKALHRRGFRYRLNAKDLPGKPDIVFPKHKAIIFIHGCFWHGHDCHLFKWPKSREDFWREKITGNQKRDEVVMGQYTRTDWRNMIIWECALKGKTRLPFDSLVDEISNWLQLTANGYEIRGLDQGLSTTSSTRS